MPTPNNDCHPANTIPFRRRQEWHKIPGLLWLNPPFDNIAPWAKKCREEATMGARVLFLTPASVGANWFADHVHGQAIVVGLQGRLHFDPANPTWGLPKGLHPILLRLWRVRLQRLEVEAVKSDIQEWKDRNGGSEPQFPVGAVFGMTAWRDLSRYVVACAREKRVTVALSRGTSVTIAVDPKLPPDAIAWYWLESNLESHLSKLRT